MEQETVASIIGSIDHLKDYTTDNPDAFTRELCLAFMSQISLIKILFSGRELSHLGIRLDKALKEVIFRKYPEYENDLSQGSDLPQISRIRKRSGKTDSSLLQHTGDILCLSEQS